MEGITGCVGNYFPGGRASLVRVFTSGTLYTLTPGTKAILVEVIGGGGAGGGSAGAGGQDSAGAGGGGGGYTRKFFYPVAPSYPYSVGAGGTAGTAGNNPGNGGGTTTFGANPTLLQATGGSGGSGQTAAAAIQVAAGGAGGVGTLGDLNLTGSTGSPAISDWDTALSGWIVTGHGGNSPLAYGTGGADQSGGDVVNTSAGIAGLGYGGGGSGGITAASATNQTGGVGSTGAVIVMEFS